MSQFFARDFKQDRWRKAALKNAYSLLGKQRFDHAAAFFLLAGSLWDAIQVIWTLLTCRSQFGLNFGNALAGDTLKHFIYSLTSPKGTENP